MKGWLMTAGAKDIRAEENFSRNRTAFGSHKGIVQGQKTKPACDMVYGTMPMSWNGCELIAVANIMDMLGRDADLPRVVHEFELNRMHFVFSSGYWGTAPKELGRYFDAHGVKYLKFRRAQELEKAAAQADCGIVSFWNNKRKGKIMINFFSGGLHTVAFRRVGPRYFVYNLHSYDTSPLVTGDLGKVYEGKRFIVGYTFNKQ